MKRKGNATQGNNLNQLKRMYDEDMKKVDSRTLDMMAIRTKEYKAGTITKAFQQARHKAIGDHYSKIRAGITIQYSRDRDKVLDTNKSKGSGLF